MSDPDAPIEPPREPHPRPQYGEYATPEEQRARIQQPAYPPASPPVAPPLAPAPRPIPQAATRAPARRHPVDLVVTVGLLAYGLVTVVTSVPALLDMSAYTSQLLSVIRVNAQLSDPDAARGFGIAAAAVMIVLWLAAASLSWLRIRRGRIAWWIPLVIGVVANLATGVLVSIPLLSDPGVRSAILSASGAG
ncbi:DUF6264 family protein [Microbacterium sp. X-17]|uniref:DUF6264 family protein n=1 Tax=Microbacterium sp. X-17 TaxID=3144404 RepID=UPI0031F51133